MGGGVPFRSRGRWTRHDRARQGAVCNKAGRQGCRQVLASKKKKTKAERPRALGDGLGQACQNTARRRSCFQRMPTTCSPLFPPFPALSCRPLRREGAPQEHTDGSEHHVGRERGDLLLSIVLDALSRRPITNQEAGAEWENETRRRNLLRRFGIFLDLAGTKRRKGSQRRPQAGQPTPTRIEKRPRPCSDCPAVMPALAPPPVTIVTGFKRDIRGTNDPAVAYVPRLQTLPTSGRYLCTMQISM